MTNNDVLSCHKKQNREKNEMFLINKLLNRYCGDKKKKKSDLFTSSNTAVM